MWGGNFSKAQYLAGFKKESTLFLSALLNSTHKTRVCYCIPILAYYQQKNKPEFSNNKNCQRQQHMPVLLAPERLRQEDLNSRTAWTEDSLLFLGYESSL